MIPAQRTGTHDDDAELHAEVARRFAAQAEIGRGQARFLLTTQTAGCNEASRFEAGVARIIQQHADAARADAQTAKETTP